MKKILVTGANGQLGKCLRREFAADPEIEAVFTDVAELDITDRKAVYVYFYSNKCLGKEKFDYLINCAAYTAVDKAESDELAASRLNNEAVGILARNAVDNDVRVIHISTDYVFSGKNFRPYDENDAPYPHSIYGRTKLEGEGILSSICRDYMIIRTSWLYSEYGRNFVKTMLSKADEEGELNVVFDQIGSPTYAGDLAAMIHHVVSGEVWKPGVFHFSNEGITSWYDFAKAIFRLAGKDKKVNPIYTSQYPTPARRPQYSVLSKKKIKNTFGVEIPYWVDSLRKCITNLQNHPEE